MQSAVQGRQLEKKHEDNSVQANYWEKTQSGEPTTLKFIVAGATLPRNGTVWREQYSLLIEATGKTNDSEGIFQHTAVNRGSCVRILLTVTRDAVSIILVVFCPLRVGRSMCIRCTQQVLFSLVPCRLNLCTVSCAQSWDTSCVVQIRDKLIWAMRNSDPRVRIVFVHGHDYDINSIFAVQATGCNFQHGSDYGVPSDPTLQVDDFSSLGKVYSRQATASVNCENSAVSFVMKYCPTSKLVRNPASIQNLLNLSCCDNFSIRSPYCCNRRSLRARSSLSKGTFVLITLGTDEELDCPPTTGCPVLSWKVSYSSHISSIAP